MRDLSLDVRGDGPDGGLSILSDNVGINAVVNHAGSEGMDIQSDRQNGSGHMTYKSGEKMKISKWRLVTKICDWAKY